VIARVRGRLGGVLPWVGGPTSVVAYFTAPSPADVTGVEQLVLCLVSITVLASVVLLAASRHFFGPPDASTRVGHLLLAVLLAVLAFALAYHSLALTRPREFMGLRTRLDALYFSLSTATSVGYGDVRPCGQVARALVTGQLAFDVVVIAAAVAVISASLQSRRSRRAEW
jgi:hypothetical protein